MSRAEARFRRSLLTDPVFLLLAMAAGLSMAAERLPAMTGAERSDRCQQVQSLAKNPAARQGFDMGQWRTSCR
jgi:hypothetical protein